MQEQHRILIIEDEKPLIRALSQKLSDEGFEILQAMDGETGLAMALDKHPDIILLDIILPKMDGITCLKKLREDAWGKNVPVIILTNLSDEESLKQSQIEHVPDYLVKSDWRLEDVTAKIRERLSAE